MEVDDRQVTTVFTVQPSFHHRHSTNPVSWSVNDRRRTTRWDVTARSPTMVALHGTRFVECRWWNDGLTVVILTIVGLRDTGPWFGCGFFSAAQIRKLSDLRQVSPDRVEIEWSCSVRWTCPTQSSGLGRGVISRPWRFPFLWWFEPPWTTGRLFSRSSTHCA